jgi:hypothetical protein
VRLVATARIRERVDRIARSMETTVAVGAWNRVRAECER